MPSAHGVSLAGEHARRILVVDDNGNTRDSLVLLLQCEGYDAEGVENGREALRVLRDGYDACLILLDLMMPVMDGWTFRVEQRQDLDLRDIPVVVMSAAVNPPQEAARLGAIAGLGKPLDILQLLDLVAQYCPKRG